MEANQWLQAALEEYKSLRTESLTSMTNQQSTLRYGTAAVGVVLGMGITVQYPQARYWILTVLVPVLSLVFFALYAIEFLRMVRVGRYINEVEGKINSLFQTTPSPPLGWEKWLNSSINGTPPRLPFYWAAPLMFSASSTFSTFMSIIYRKDGPFCTQWNVPISLIAGIAIQIMIVSVAVILTRYRQSLDKYFNGHNQGVQGTPAGAGTPDA